MDTAKRPLKVFLCHSSADKAAVRQLYEKLIASGVDAWLDEKKLLAGQQWNIEIQKAVREADAVIICLSKTSITKEGYVQKEIKFALDIALEKPEGTIYLIPARIEECKVPVSLSDWQWVDLFEEGGYLSLIKGLNVRSTQAGVNPIFTELDYRELPEKINKIQQDINDPFTSLRNRLKSQFGMQAEFVKNLFVLPKQDKLEEEDLVATLVNEQETLIESDIPDKENILRFFSEHGLFTGLSEDEIRNIVAYTEVQTYSKGKNIYRQEDQGSAVYFVYKGKVRLRRKVSSDDPVTRDITLHSGDCFGNLEAITESRYTQTATAISGIILLIIKHIALKDLVQRIKVFGLNYMFLAKSMRLARSIHFLWMRENEKILLISRRHIMVLYQSLIVPALSLLFPLGIFIWGSIIDAAIMLAIGLLILIWIILWAIWQAIEWSNDYYIVTNQRVISLEKVIGLYDSREETSFEAITSIDLQKSNLGRYFDFGDVIIRTLTGVIVFRDISEPNIFARLLGGFWKNAKEFPSELQKNIDGASNEDFHATSTNNLFEVIFFNSSLWKSIQMRSEDGDTFTSRKHWFALMQETIFQLVIFLFLLFAPLLQKYFLQGTTAWLPAISIILLGADIYWAYRSFTRWSNSIYQITPDQILSMQRETNELEKRVGVKIEDIVAVEAGRFSVAAFLFNFGKVTIKLKNEEFHLVDIPNPTEVRAIIDRRRIELIHNKKQKH